MKYAKLCSRNKKKQQRPKPKSHYTYKYTILWWFGGLGVLKCCCVKKQICVKILQIYPFVFHSHTVVKHHKVEPIPCFSLDCNVNTVSISMEIHKDNL